MIESVLDRIERYKKERDNWHKCAEELAFALKIAVSCENKPSGWVTDVQAALAHFDQLEDTQ